MQRVRLLSFNIHGGRSLDGQRDLNRIRLMMQKLDIDIGVFQEVETRSSHGGSLEDIALLAEDERPYRLACPSMLEGLSALQPGLKNTSVENTGLENASAAQNCGWYGNLIVSRFPIVRGLVHNLETHPSLEPRMAADALIATPWGRLRVIGTHLSLSIFERFSEARNLLRLMQAVEETEPNPILLMGDINEWQYPSRLIRYMDAHFKQLRCKPTFPSFFPLLKLDRVWCDAPGLQVRAHRVDGKEIRHISDHLPIVIEVEFPAAAVAAEAARVA